MSQGIPFSYFDAIPEPDTEGWVTVSFEAPAESFWIMLGAEKLGATEPTTAYIDDISLREGWIVDKKCPIPGSIYAKKGKNIQIKSGKVTSSSKILESHDYKETIAKGKTFILYTPEEMSQGTRNALEKEGVKIATNEKELTKLVSDNK